MWRARTKPYHHQLQSQQQMCQLRWRPSILYQIIPSLEKRKRNFNHKTHKKHSLSRSPENSWRLHKNKTYSQISQNNPKTESKKEENCQEPISKLLILGPKDWPEFIQEIKPILLKLSSNSTNPKAITEHKLEKNIKIHWNKSRKATSKRRNKNHRSTQKP